MIHPAGDITIEAIFFKISNLLVEWSGQLIFLGAMIAMLDPLRHLLLALGDRWVDAGWLANRDDIFYLLQHELLAVLEKNLPGLHCKHALMTVADSFSSGRQSSRLM
ncbi:MAG: hypothetical protein P8163_09915 [Candidatus Thiodiazotropha sp.]